MKLWSLKENMPLTVFRKGDLSHLEKMIDIASILLNSQMTLISRR